MPLGHRRGLLLSCQAVRGRDMRIVTICASRSPEDLRKKIGIGEAARGGKRAGDGECEDGERAGGIEESFAYFTFRLFSVLFTHLLFFSRALQKKKKREKKGEHADAMTGCPSAQEQEAKALRIAWVRVRRVTPAPESRPRPEAGLLFLSRNSSPVTA